VVIDFRPEDARVIRIFAIALGSVVLVLGVVFAVLAVVYA